MYEVWKNDGHYIQGRRIHRRKLNDLESAKKLALNISGFDHFSEPVNSDAYLKSDVVLWISDAENMPIGLIRKIDS